VDLPDLQFHHVAASRTDHTGAYGVALSKEPTFRDFHSGQPFLTVSH
jgi:hypothetical protein